ncbi:hypothetical protein ACIPUD_10870 [Bradyrhizobium sp. CAR08]
MKPSSKQRRTAAIAKRFQPWYLTDGRTSRALHIGAAFHDLRKIAIMRKRWPFMDRASRDWHLAVWMPSTFRSCRFNIGLYPNRLP